MALDPDVQIRISLIGSAERLHARRADSPDYPDAAIAELRTIAGGRRDLLSHAAGHFLGVGNWNSEPCYQLLVSAGGTDQDLINAGAEEVRANRARFGLGHTTSGTTAPPR